MCLHKYVASWLCVVACGPSVILPLPACSVSFLSPHSSLQETTCLLSFFFKQGKFVPTLGPLLSAFSKELLVSHQSTISSNATLSKRPFPGHTSPRLVPSVTFSCLLLYHHSLLLFIFLCIVCSASLKNVNSPEVDSLCL